MSVHARMTKRLPAPMEHQCIWSLSEPIVYQYRYNGNDREALRTRHVVTSTATIMGRPETYIFASDPEGEVIDWGELEGSYRGDLDHERAIREAGWVVEENRPCRP